VAVDNKKFLVKNEASSNACAQAVISPQVAWLLTNVLADNQARSPVFGTNSIINIPGYQVAVKTGTTNNLRDNWTIGYTSDVLVAAWVGNNNNSPMSRVASGITGASPIWREIMAPILAQRSRQTFPVPSGIITQKVCLSWNEDKTVCRQEKEEYFINVGTNQPDNFTADVSQNEKLLPAITDSKE
jgi:membrane peptidoglycan carboxypeptidase